MSDSCEQTPRSRHSLRNQSSESKIIHQNAEDFFSAAQKQQLRNFFERQGETVYRIFQNTVTSAGVMTLFIVFNDLSKDIRDVVVDSEFIFKKNLLFPSTFDNIILKKYRKLCTSINYILKCKYCDFICYTAYTLEHMAFVHDRHYGFGLKNSSSTKEPPLKCTIKTSTKRWETTNMAYCIFQTPQSGGHHYFRDHFKNLINYRYKQLDVQFNNEENLLSICYEKYLKFLKDNGKLYTIQSCDHAAQFYDDTHCKCIKASIVFYKTFHSQLYHILSRLNLTNWREGRFEAIGYIRPQKLKSPQGDAVTMATEIKYQKLRKHTRKNSIFMEFEERICKLHPHFFEDPRNRSPRDTVLSKIDTHNGRKGSDGAMTSNQQEVIDVFSSDESNDKASYTGSTVQFEPIAESHVISSGNNTTYKHSMHENLKITGQFSLINPNPLYYVILSGDDNSKEQNRVSDSVNADVKFQIPNLLATRITDTSTDSILVGAHLVDTQASHTAFIPNVVTTVPTTANEQLIPYITANNSITSNLPSVHCDQTPPTIADSPFNNPALTALTQSITPSMTPPLTETTKSQRLTETMVSYSPPKPVVEDEINTVSDLGAANSAERISPYQTERTPELASTDGAKCNIETEFKGNSRIWVNMITTSNFVDEPVTESGAESPKLETLIDGDSSDSFFESQLDTFTWPTYHQAEVFRNHLVADTFHFDPIEGKISTVSYRRNINKIFLQ